jgi:hypothetical protein
MEGEILHPFDSVTQSVLFSVVDLGVLIEELLQYLLHLGVGALCLSVHSLASVVLPLMQLLEFINRKNSVILKVCIRRPMSGIPARQQVASTLINLVIVLVMFARGG